MEKRNPVDVWLALLALVVVVPLLFLLLGTMTDPTYQAGLTARYAAQQQRREVDAQEWGATLRVWGEQAGELGRWLAVAGSAAAIVWVSGNRGLSGGRRTTRSAPHRAAYARRLGSEISRICSPFGPAATVTTARGDFGEHATGGGGSNCTGRRISASHSWTLPSPPCERLCSRTWWKLQHGQQVFPCSVPHGLPM